MMNANVKPNKFKACIDVAAIISIIYPVAVILWGLLGGLAGTMEARDFWVLGAMFLGMPGAVWLLVRCLRASEVNTIAEKFLLNKSFQVTSVITILVASWVFLYFMGYRGLK